MSTEPYRKGGCLEATILLAATVAVLTAMRYHWLILESNYSGLWNCLSSIGIVLYIISHLVAMWTLACLVFRLRQPRPVFRRLIRLPGTTASLAALLVLAAHLMNCGTVFGIFALNLDVAYSRKDFDWLAASRGIPTDVGLAVAAVWFIQALACRWRSEATWIDRMGRVLGVFWIATIPFGVFTWFFGP